MSFERFCLIFGGAFFMFCGLLLAADTAVKIWGCK